MKRIRFFNFSICFIIFIITTAGQTSSFQENHSSNPPISFEEADQRAEELLKQLTIDQKIKLLGGYSRFFIHGFPEHGIPFIFMADATQGVRLSRRLKEPSMNKPLEKTTAFPCPILLASTWNPKLAQEYAKCVGEECRAAGVCFLLGPGLNFYRISQCGRNFEYFGEDPFLISRIIENYVIGVQSTGTIATLKHFVCNNTDFYRRRSNSIVNERTLHEIYLPGFKAGIDVGAMAVMTAYNKLNGEWCGQSNYVINNILRGQLGFQWLVMSDWTSVYDGEKVIKSGQNLEMPELKALKDTKELLKSGKVNEDQINQMAKSILRTCIGMGFHDRPQQDLTYLKNFDKHEQVALNVAREGIVLLKNENKILPIRKNNKLRIVATGKFLHQNPFGGGSARVKGYNQLTHVEVLKDVFGERIEMVNIDDNKKIKSADIVLLSIGTLDCEGSDRPFDLPEDELKDIHHVLDLNKKSVVLINSGAGINMSPWIDKASGVVYGWYGGQIGNRALVEILCGDVNPSGKLPISIEKKFEDSPGYGYLPEGEKLYTGWARNSFTHKEYDIEYEEGIFVGYRWYEHKKIKPLFGFGFGLSYSTFEYSDLTIHSHEFSKDDDIEISLSLKNCGPVDGAETAQVYIHDTESSHPRPVKELKGFKKVFLKAGEKKEIKILLKNEAFGYWSPDSKRWTVEPGHFKVLVGSSSDQILLEEDIVCR